MRARKSIAVAAAGGRAATAAPWVPDTDKASLLAQARRQVADEAAALRAAQGAPDAERARLLADLATRIEALLAWLTGNLAVGGQLTRLARLGRALRVCDRPGTPRGGELDALWQEAIRLLTEFAAEDDRRAFWKRPR